MTTPTIAPPKHADGARPIDRLSFSSLSSYADCPERWRLEYGYGLRGPTWWSTVGGTAVHTVTEFEDRAFMGEGVQVPTYAEALEEAIAEQVRRSGFPEGTIRASGAKLVKVGVKGGPNKKDKAWWLEMGPKMVDAWRGLRDQGYSIWRKPDGTPAIEVEFEILLAGRPSKGMIDRIMVLPDGTLAVVDLKGGEAPKSDLQLGAYVEAMRQEFGLEIGLGAFFMAAQALDPSYTMRFKRTDQFSTEYIEAQYEQAWRGIEAGMFLPSPGGFCHNGCTVRPYCSLMGEAEFRNKLPILEVRRDTDRFDLTA